MSPAAAAAYMAVENAPEQPAMSANNAVLLSARFDVNVRTTNIVGPVPTRSFWIVQDLRSTPTYVGVGKEQPTECAINYNTTSIWPNSIRLRVRTLEPRDEFRRSYDYTEISPKLTMKLSGISRKEWSCCDQNGIVWDVQLIKIALNNRVDAFSIFPERPLKLMPIDRKKQ